MPSDFGSYNYKIEAVNGNYFAKKEGIFTLGINNTKALDPTAAFPDVACTNIFSSDYKLLRLICQNYRNYNNLPN